MATSDHGCIDTAMATVYVEEDLIYYVPNTFTPDGDGNNEVFRPVITSGMDPNYYHFYIYNRWGEAVFESQDIEDGWDGTVHGLVAQDGTYTWKIEFKSTVKRRVDNVVTGHVNILK
jgi:gliding motility-associated-like protein